MSVTMRSTRSKRSKRSNRLLSAVALLLLGLLAGCSLRMPPIGQTTAPGGSASRAEAQDLIPSPTPRQLATPTVEPTDTPDPLIANAPPAPLTMGQAILVSLSRQQLYAYEDGTLAFTFTVETGRPSLATPTGVYHIFLKNCSDSLWTNNSASTGSHNVNCAQHNGDGYQEMFYSPWSQGSPYWYAPTHINYAMEFKEGGFFLHDAWWHVSFGPGGNVPHQLSDGTWETGSHGCVGMRTTDAERLYGWAAIGVTVYIRADV